MGAVAALAFAVGYGARSAHVPTPPAAAPAPPAERAAHDLGVGGVGAAPGQDPWLHTTHPGMATQGWNWTQLSMSRAGNFPNNAIKRFHADQLRERGPMWAWHTTYARSIPAVVEGLGERFAADKRAWTVADYRREWGHNRVTTAFSDDRNFNRGTPHPTYGRLVRQPERRGMPFSEAIDLMTSPRTDEFVSVQQSPSTNSFAEFGLPELPPQIEDLVKTHSARVARLACFGSRAHKHWPTLFRSSNARSDTCQVKHTLASRNFWAATTGKVSVLHYDWQDSVLLQIAGTKKLTIIDPARMQTAYPCVACRRRALSRAAARRRLLTAAAAFPTGTSRRSSALHLASSNGTSPRARSTEITIYILSRRV